MTFRVVIPARYASTRLPGKVLRLVDGRPMIEHVYRVAEASGAAQVIVATDDERVAAAVQAFSGELCMTSESHQSGTDRICEVAEHLQWKNDEIVVNLQGDEPLMPPALVAQVAQELAAHPSAHISTLCGVFETVEEWRDPNIVKVVRDIESFALYFSRAPIPWDREGGARGAPKLPRELSGRHIGLYAYRVETLRRFSKIPPAGIEETEALEQLRALYHGLRIYVGNAAEVPGPGVDTEADLQRVASLLRNRSGQ